MITLVNINEFLVCAFILWRSALGLLMGKFFLCLTELTAHNTSVFYFQDNNLSKYHGFSLNLISAFILWRAAPKPLGRI